MRSRRGSGTAPRPARHGGAGRHHGRLDEPAAGGEQRLRVGGEGLDLDAALDAPGAEHAADLHRVGRQRIVAGAAFTARRSGRGGLAA
jgi:hypothetical protein